MSISPIVGGIKPTKGFLLELRRRIEFVEGGCELLKMKRDHLSDELRKCLDQLVAQRTALETALTEAYGALTTAYIWLGSSEIESQAALVEKNLALEILPRSIMGVLIPSVKKLEVPPPIEGRFNVILYMVATKFRELVNDLVKMAELEARTERVADELGKTNRKVNALEKILIPGYRQAASYIEDRLEEDLLEDFIRTKLVRGLLTKRRQ